MVPPDKDWFYPRFFLWLGPDRISNKYKFFQGLHYTRFLCPTDTGHHINNMDKVSIEQSKLVQTLRYIYYNCGIIMNWFSSVKSEQDE